MKIANFNRSSGQQGAPKIGYRSIKVSHDTGTFFISGQGTVTLLASDIKVIGLGLMRSRNYWDKANPTIVDNATKRYKALCRSHDGVTGIPQEGFPWMDSVFANVSSNESLPCAQCNFKGWMSGESQPRCSQTWTLPVVVPSFRTDPYAEQEVFLMPFSASSISPLTDYLTPLRDQGIPVYSRVTNIVLRKVSKGSRIFSVAEFKKGDDVDDEHWPWYSTKLHEVREFMRPDAPPKPFTPISLL